MTKTSDKVVCDYLSNMFMDLTLSDSDMDSGLNSDINGSSTYVPLDSIQHGCQMVPCIDPFKLMTIDNAVSSERIWLAYLSILNILMILPNGYLKQYCIRQCQTLKLKLNKHRIH